MEEIALTVAGLWHEHFHDYGENTGASNMKNTFFTKDCCVLCNVSKTWKHQTLSSFLLISPDRVQLLDSVSWLLIESWKFENQTQFNPFKIVHLDMQELAGSSKIL